MEMDGIFVKSRYKIRRKIYMIVIIQEEKGEGPKRSLWSSNYDFVHKTKIQEKKSGTA